MDITSNNYKKGDAFPPRANTSVLRIYSYQPCPFAERARLVLHAKGIEHEEINVLLRADAPEWLKEKNPEVKVPIIEFDDNNKILTESLIVAEYLDEAYPGRQLRAADPYQRAKDKVFFELVSPHLFVYAKAVYSTDEKTVSLNNSKESLKKAEQLLKERKTGNFLSGDSAPGFTDYMLWPFVERIPASIEILSESNPEDLIRKEFPVIHDYIKQMESDPTVQKVCLNYDVLLDVSKKARKTFVGK